MEQTPAPFLRPRVHTGLATASLITAIVGLFIPFAGIVMGIVAIILGAIALHHKTSSTVPAIIGIVIGAFAIVFGAIIIVLISLFTGGIPTVASARDTAVTAQINEQKDFTLHDTIRMGPIDVKIADVQRNYTPTADEVASTKGVKPAEIVSADSTYPQTTTLNENEVEYVKVEGTVQVNGRTYLGDDDLELANTTLNNVLPYTYVGGLDGYRNSTTAPTTAAPFTYVFRIRKGSDALVMQRSVSIWKKISAIVGTEGMPRAQLVYTISLQ
jgi:hypothetical protein